MRLQTIAVAVVLLLALCGAEANLQRIKRGVIGENNNYRFTEAPTVPATNPGGAAPTVAPAPAAAPSAAAAAPAPAPAPATVPPAALAGDKGGEVYLSHNGGGNNIAIRNTNTVVLTGGVPQTGAAPAGYPAMQPGPAGPALPGKQDVKEQADAEKLKQDAAAKAAEEKAKQEQIQLDAKWTVFGGDYVEPTTFLFKSTVCFVSGMLRGSEGLVGRLPEKCRPKARLVFSLMLTNKAARVDVLADGRIYTVAGGGGDGWLSLSPISFSIDSNPEITLVGGWGNFGGDYRGNSLTKESGVCMISGLIRGSQWGSMGRVDGDCTPDRPLIFSANNNDAVTRLDIQSNGYFNYAGGAANNGWVSLDGMVYTKTGGMPLTLLNGWVNYGNWREAKYERLGDVCVISGLIKSGSWNSLITTLPAECRPKKRTVFGGNVHIASARIDVLPDGSVTYVTGKANWDWVSLSNIHFTV